MMSYKWQAMTVEEIAAAICQHLTDHNISAVLTGGACVTIYSNNQYESGDLDFVTSSDLKALDRVMSDLGFMRKGGTRHYDHPDCPYFVEFPSPPLMVGDEFIKQDTTLDTPYGTLHLLRPEDSVKDRLAAFYHWKDRQALNQAVMICKTRKIDLSEIRRWSEGEASLEQFEYFKNQLQGKAKIDNRIGK